LWIQENEVLLGAVVLLRQLPDGAPTADSILDLRHMTTARLSWELWTALVEGRGEDAESLLLGVVPLADVELAREALWGSGGGGRHLTVVRSD
jgi:hypothetical protein